jgi:DNA-binding MarR family transcriptional regulator
MNNQGHPSQAQPEPLIAEVLVLLGQVAHRFDSEDHENWQWLAEHSDNSQTVEILRDLTLVTMRVIDAIGHLEPVNGATISAQFRVPKGTVSKVTRRLVAQELVQTESLPNNKKEILFRLTPLGAEVWRVNRAFDERMQRGFTRFLRRYSLDELRFLVRLLGDAATASFMTLGEQESTSADDAHPNNLSSRAPSSAPSIAPDD